MARNAITLRNPEGKLFNQLNLEFLSQSLSSYLLCI